MNLRALAAQIIFEVAVKHRSLADCLPEKLSQIKDDRDRALVQALCYGVCRFYFQLENIAQSLLTKPFKTTDQDIFILLLVGLYQLKEMHVPPHAAVSETVNAAAKKTWAKPLINAVLRNYQRNREKFDLPHHAHPVWLAEKIRQDWPNDAEAIFTANNQPPPFSLRINLNRISRENYLAMTGRSLGETAAGIILSEAMDVKILPGFLQGEVSVQDGAAQLAAPLLQLAPGQRVLDACAAPGGKTAHILELEPRLQKLIAIDRDENRTSKIKENLQRLNLVAECICADAAQTSTWWDGELFDRILLDAPCSGSGIIRRHPDIKLLRRATDIHKLAAEQKRLLEALWPLLKPQGMLLYSTCSIFPEENVEIMRVFLREHPEAQEVKIKSTWGKECSVGKQILPGMDDMDGFYYAGIWKEKEH